MGTARAAFAFDTVVHHDAQEPSQLIEDIAEMHTKFGVNEVIRGLDQEKLLSYLEFRAEFLDEELTELVDGINTRDSDLVVDSLIDLIVVAIGTLNAFDVDVAEAWNRVHQKNMEKEAGVNANRPNPYGLPDLIKPAGWTPPTHEGNFGLIEKAFSHEQP